MKRRSARPKKKAPATRLRTTSATSNFVASSAARKKDRRTPPTIWRPDILRRAENSGDRCSSRSVASTAARASAALASAARIAAAGATQRRLRIPGWAIIHSLIRPAAPSSGAISRRPSAVMANRSATAVATPDGSSRTSPTWPTNGTPRRSAMARHAVVSSPGTARPAVTSIVSSSATVQPPGGSRVQSMVSSAARPAIVKLKSGRATTEITRFDGVTP